jgi:sulfite reductase alpha subunit-like flavoprotein
MDWLGKTRSETRPGAQPFKGVDFAVFGLGNKKTHAENFCVVGRKVDAWLAELGGTRQLPRVDGDDSDDLETQFDDWQLALLENLKKEAALATAATVSSTTAATAPDPIKPKLARQKGGTCETTVCETETAVAASIDDGSAAARSFLDLFPGLCTGLYTPQTKACPVTSNRDLTPQSNRSTAEMHIDIRFVVFLALVFLTNLRTAHLPVPRATRPCMRRATTP